MKPEHIRIRNAQKALKLLKARRDDNLDELRALNKAIRCIERSLRKYGIPPPPIL